MTGYKIIELVTSYVPVTTSSVGLLVMNLGFGCACGKRMTCGMRSSG
jgi:hypothetical protein